MKLRTALLAIFALMAGSSPGQLVWKVGTDDDGWPEGNGGGPNASFVQENGTINPLPGRPNSMEAPMGADNDYYFAGSYANPVPGVIQGYGDYAPIGTVSVNEEAAERAFAGADRELRYHFNIPAGYRSSDRFVITFDAVAIDEDAADSRYGVEVYFNNQLVGSQILIRPAQLNKAITTAPFFLWSVGGQAGPGFDNIVSLRGRSYASEGGGNWLGFDYVQLERYIPPAVFPWAEGTDDNGWPAGDGGGSNASFVQESGIVNLLPGSPVSVEAPMGADNDYYFAGRYTTVIPGNGMYNPVGVVDENEEAAERAFAAADNELRYHFNLPATMQPADLLSVTFDAVLLDTAGATNGDPRYGIEVYCNGVRVQREIVIRPGLLGVRCTTPDFSLASVSAQAGPGFDNIVSLRGINYNAAGGGNWMGLDYVQLTPVANPKLEKPFVHGGQVTLKWSGAGQLEWSPNLASPWTPIVPTPTPPYTEPIAPGGRRFYRLRH